MGIYFPPKWQRTTKHPTQLYEAGSYILLFLYLMFSYLQMKRYTPRGRIFGQFLILLFGARFFIEFVKNVQEKWEIDMITTYGINMGQLLSIPFVMVGMYFFIRSFSQKAKKDAINFAEKSERPKGEILGTKKK